MLISLLLLCGCQSVSSGPASLPGILSLDSLRSDQVAILTSRGSSLLKSATMGTETKNRTFQPDWQQELAFWDDCDLSTPGLANALEVKRGAGTLHIEVKEGEKSKVRKLVFELDAAGEVSAFHCQFRDDAVSPVYYESQSLRVLFKEGILVSYEVEGLQKIFFGDTLRYSITGVVL